MATRYAQSKPYKREATIDDFIKAAASDGPVSELDYDPLAGGGARIFLDMQTDQWEFSAAEFEELQRKLSGATFLADIERDGSELSVEEVKLLYPKAYKSAINAWFGRVRGTDRDFYESYSFWMDGAGSLKAAGRHETVCSTWDEDLELWGEWIIPESQQSTELADKLLFDASLRLS